jgi:hypothetical protein
MGLDKISVTLYDILGYLLPGYVLLLACSISEANFWGTNLFALSRISHNTVVSIVVAYFLGQSSHAIASLIPFNRMKVFPNKSYHLGPEVNKRVSKAIEEAYSLEIEDDQKLSRNEKYLLADSYIVSLGGSAERDILMAREGFFKASAVAFATLVLTLLSTLFLQMPNAQVQPGVFISLNKIGIVLLSFFLLLITWLFAQRYVFFNCVKTNNALLTFLALRQKKDISGSRAD